MSTDLPDDDPGFDGTLEDSSVDGPVDDELMADELDYGLPDGDDEGSNWGLVLGLLVAVGAISFLVFDGLQAETYFFDVHEAVERGDELTGETIRIRGDVEDDSLTSDHENLVHRFDVGSKGETMSIRYEKALPDTFENDSEVVAEGRLDEDFVLHADEVLVKCPSRYEGGPPADEYDGEYDDYDGDYGDYDDYDHTTSAPEADDTQASR